MHNRNNPTLLFLRPTLAGFSSLGFALCVGAQRQTHLLSSCSHQEQQLCNHQISKPAWNAPHPALDGEATQDTTNPTPPLPTHWALGAWQNSARVRAASVLLLKNPKANQNDTDLM